MIASAPMVILAAAIVLILAVLAAAAFVVATDAAGRPQGERLHALKDWQQLIGAVLGFMGAAGVLVLSTQIDAEQARQEALAREHTLGLALAYEAESLSNEIAGMIGVVDYIHAQGPDVDYAHACTELVGLLAKSLDKTKAVWTAALGQMVEFGDENLQLFVRYHLYYDGLVELATQPDPRLCERDAENEINRYRDRFMDIFDLYRDIATVYGTAIVEPVPVDPAAPAGTAAPTTGVTPDTARASTTP